jgi:uncharacterized membrane protein YoaK (UPF0700 family)
VDAITFLELGLFTAHIIGNLAVRAAQIVNSRPPLGASIVPASR